MRADPDPLARANPETPAVELPLILHTTNGKSPDAAMSNIEFRAVLNYPASQPVAILGQFKSQPQSRNRYSLEGIQGTCCAPIPRRRHPGGLLAMRELPTLKLVTELTFPQ